MAIMIQKVAYSEKLGVFLGCKDGIPLWSKDPNVTGKELAPTFQDRDDFARYLKANMGDEYWRDNTDVVSARLQEVWPRQDGGMAGVEEIANSGLPRWGNG